MHHFFHCHNHCCHWLFTITYRTVSDYFWILWTCWKWHPHGWSFILGVENKSQETKLRWVRRVGYHSYFYLPKLQPCPPVHCLSESTISGSVIILNVFSILAATDVANFLVVMLFSLQQQIPNKQYPHSEIQSPTCSWCLTWFAILPWDEERKGFATERTYVRFLGWNFGHRLCLLLWPSRGSSGHFFLHSFICMNYQGMNFTCTVFNWSFLAFESGKPLIPISLSQKAISGTPCIFYVVSKFEAMKGKVVPVCAMKEE